MMSTENETPGCRVLRNTMRVGEIEVTGTPEHLSVVAGVCVAFLTQDKWRFRWVVEQSGRVGYLLVYEHPGVGGGALRARRRSLLPELTAAIRAHWRAAISAQITAAMEELAKLRVVHRNLLASGYNTAAAEVRVQALEAHTAALIALLKKAEDEETRLVS